MRQYELLKGKLNATEQLPKVTSVKAVGKREVANNNKAQTKEMMCYNCGDKGHLSRNCSRRGEGPNVTIAKNLGTLHRNVRKR